MKLLLLGHDGLVDALLSHARCALMVSIDAHEWVVCAGLLFAQLAHVVDWVVTRVLGQRERDLFEGISERAHCILFNSADLVSLLGDGNRACKLSGATTADDVAVLDHVADDADSVVEAALCLVANCS